MTTKASTDKPRVRTAAARAKRQPGRPTKAKAERPERQRDQLLDAAIRCYSRNGIAASSVRDIAREAQVTPALVNYYFGGKDELRDAVVAERVLPAVAQMREGVQGAGDDVPALIASFVSGVGRVASANPWFPALWVREVLCEGGTLRDLLFTHVGPQVPVAMVGRFKAAQERGEINPDLDPRLLMVSLVGLTLFPIAGAPIWRRLISDAGFGAEDLDMDTLRRHTLALLDGGLGLG